MRRTKPAVTRETPLPPKVRSSSWAAAAPLLWLRTLLRFEPRAAEGTVALQPELPPWLGRLCVDGIAVAGERLTVDIADGSVEVSGTGSLRVVAGEGPTQP